ncbi:MAG: NADH:flavin oxidoreductase/NADH oxidase family protein [Cyclobacteriaceae bacterium]
MILEPLKLPCGAILSNRLAKAAMTERLSTDGEANEGHKRLYQKWGDTGAGLLLTGNVMIDGEHLESSGNVVIDDTTDQSKLQEWTEAARINGSHIWAQISHSGRQTNKFVNRKPKAPSEVQLHKMGLFGKPQAITDEEILQLIEKFASAAAICKNTGFTGIQIHAAHGYLISQFLSPLTNRRSDRWGGSLENRSRFLSEIIQACRVAVGSDFPISVKLNSADFQRGGFDEEDSLKVITMLDKLSIDLLEISGGTYERLVFFDREGLSESTGKREAYFLEFAGKVREVTDTPLMVTGGFRTRKLAEEALTSGEIDVVGMARPFVLYYDQIASFLEGSVQAFENHRLTTPFKAIKDSAEAGFYARNIIRLANGKPVSKKLSPFVSAIHLVVNEFKSAMKRK